jgi:hypothetical protein
MQIWKTKTQPEILKSLEAELAKASRELKCATADVEKTSNRVRFCLSAIHELADRQDPADMKPQ